MNLTSNTVGPDNGQRFFGFGWKLDANHCLVSMGGDGGMWQFDAAAFEAGDPNHGFKLVKWIGAHGGGMTVAGNIVYFVQSADPNWTGGSKAYDHHMKSFDLSNPTAPVVDYGRIVDQAGRTPYRIEGMSADTHGHLYLSGDWRVNPNANSANTPGEPADPNTYMSLRQRYGTTGSYVYLWRGQFFGTVSVASNQAPVVNAGPNAKVMIPNALTLAGTVSDDGLPNPPGVCTIAWSTLSGPGTVSFANASLPGTTATFSTAGTYVLKLTANDSALTGTSNVTVTALAPGDFNGDGKVDGVDFLIWQSHYPTASGATPDGGDANGDGKVDGVDFLVWQANYRG
jgi:hypothetical protein